MIIILIIIAICFGNGIFAKGDFKTEKYFSNEINMILDAISLKVIATFPILDV